MKLKSIPEAHLVALATGCAGFAGALSDVDEDPTAAIEVVRHKVEGKASTWSLRLTAGSLERRLPLDGENLAAMKAAVPIHLIDMVREIQRENPVVLAAGLMGVFGEMLPLLRSGATKN